MNEDDLFDMIKTLPEPTILPSTKSAKKVRLFFEARFEELNFKLDPKRAPVKTVASKPTSPNGSTSSTFAQPSADVVSTPFLSTRIESSQKDAVSEPSRIFNPPKPISSSTSELIHKDVVNERSKPSQQPIATHQVHSDDEGERVPTYSSPHSAFELLWADKWRPTSLKEISGNAPAILRYRIMFVIAIKFFLIKKLLVFVKRTLQASSVVDEMEVGQSAFAKSSFDLWSSRDRKIDDGSPVVRRIGISDRGIQRQRYSQQVRSRLDRRKVGLSTSDNQRFFRKVGSILE